MVKEIEYEAIVNQMIAEGYKEFKPNTIISPSAKKAYQKRYEDEKGIKYYITCYEYDWSEYPNISSGRDYHKSWEFDVQFTLEDKRSFNIQTVGWYFFENKWKHKATSLKEVEDFFEKTWSSLNCQHYELKYQY